MAKSLQKAVERWMQAANEHAKLANLQADDPNSRKMVLIFIEEL